MQSNVIGTTMPVLEFILEPNEAVISEAGELSCLVGRTPSWDRTTLQMWIEACCPRRCDG